ncbi:MAG: hypothetical protein ABIH59_00400 [archaeon]
MRWMKVAGIIGIVFLVIGFGYMIYSIINMSGDSNISQPSSGGLGTTLTIIFGVLFLIAFCFFYFGFVKLGEKTESNLLRISSWMVVAGVFLLLLSILFIWFSIKSVVDEGSNQINQNIINLNTQDLDKFDIDLDQFDSNSLFTGNAVTNLSSIAKTTGFLLTMIIIILIFNLVSIHLFYVALAGISHKLKFSRLAAIFGLLTISSYIIVAGLLVSVFMLLFAFGGGNKFYVVFISHIPAVLGLLALLFMSLCLFDASKKFESEYKSTSLGPYNPAVPQPPTQSYSQYQPPQHSFHEEHQPHFPHQEHSY